MPKDIPIPNMKPYKPEQEDKSKKRRSKVHTPDIIPPIPIIIPPMQADFEERDRSQR